MFMDKISNDLINFSLNFTQIFNLKIKLPPQLKWIYQYTMHRLSMVTENCGEELKGSY